MPTRKLSRVSVWLGGGNTKLWLVNIKISIRFAEIGMPLLEQKEMSIWLIYRDMRHNPLLRKLTASHFHKWNYLLFELRKDGLALHQKLKVVILWDQAIVEAISIRKILFRHCDILLTSQRQRRVAGGMLCLAQLWRYCWDRRDPIYVCWPSTLLLACSELAEFMCYVCQMWRGLAKGSSLFRRTYKESRVLGKYRKYKKPNVEVGNFLISIFFWST